MQRLIEPTDKASYETVCRTTVMVMSTQMQIDGTAGRKAYVAVFLLVILKKVREQVFGTKSAISSFCSAQGQAKRGPDPRRLRDSAIQVLHHPIAC